MRSLPLGPLVTLLAACGASNSDTTGGPPVGAIYVVTDEDAGRLMKLVAR